MVLTRAGEDDDGDGERFLSVARCGAHSLPW